MPTTTSPSVLVPPSVVLSVAMTRVPIEGSMNQRWARAVSAPPTSSAAATTSGRKASSVGSHGAERAPQPERLLGGFGAIVPIVVAGLAATRLVEQRQHHRTALERGQRIAERLLRRLLGFHHQHHLAHLRGQHS